MKEVVLEKIKFLISAYVSDSVKDDLIYDEFYEAVYQRMIYNLKVFLWGREVSKSVEETVNVPVSWWDAFKEEHFPKFLKKRFPVKWRTINVVVKHYHVCPHLNYKTNRPHITFLSADYRMPTNYYCPKTKDGQHDWHNHVDTWTTVDGDGHLVLTCKACGFTKHLEGT